MPDFLVAARNDQPQATGSWAKLRTDKSRDCDVNIVDPKLEMQLEFSHNEKWRHRYFQGGQSSLLGFLKIIFC